MNNDRNHGTVTDSSLTPHLSSLLWWRTVYFFSAAGMTLGFSLRIEGRDRMPRHGAALLIANHQSFLDPVLVGLAAPRPLRYLARKTLFHHPSFTWLIRSLGAVPIDQEGLGKEGLVTILGQLRQGQAVLVFPEGERTGDGQILPLRPGIQLLIKRAQAPIVPIAIAGAFDAWPRSRPLPVPAPLFLPPGRRTLAVVVGRPLDAQAFACLPREQMLSDLHAELQKLHQRAEQLRRKSH
jgi:1-acyl-sn-glycerol-3-phosphate acyltransferase